MKKSIVIMFLLMSSVYAQSDDAIIQLESRPMILPYSPLYNIKVKYYEGLMLKLRGEEYRYTIISNRFREANAMLEDNEGQHFDDLMFTISEHMDKMVAWSTNASTTKDTYGRSLHIKIRMQNIDRWIIHMREVKIAKDHNSLIYTSRGFDTAAQHSRLLKTIVEEQIRDSSELMHPNMVADIDRDVNTKIFSNRGER